MSITPRTISRADILPMAEYAAIRKDRRHQITEIKRSRRVAVGPYTTFYFENYATMNHQIHEMLFIERGGEGQIQDELDAYNPLIPNGSELVATVMIEVDEPVRRHSVLFSLGGIENHMVLTVGGDTVRGQPDLTRENTSPDGKASSVQFIRFPLSASQKVSFRAQNAAVMIGFDHPHYGHLALVGPDVRKALSEDLVD